MSYRRLATFETLENRRALAVTAAVSAGGDLIVSGDADGAVEIVAVSEGAYRVTDNGVVIADADVLTGVTDDIRINLDKTAGADNTVTVNLAGSDVVDTVYARLGDGDNTFQLIGTAVDDVSYRGGDGDDAVTLDATVDGSASLQLGDGDNTVEITGAIGRLSIKGGDGDDQVTIDAAAEIEHNLKRLPRRRR